MFAKIGGSFCGGRKPPSDEGGGFLRSKKTEEERNWHGPLGMAKTYLSLSLAGARQLPRQREPYEIAKSPNLHRNQKSSEISIINYASFISGINDALRFVLYSA